MNPRIAEILDVKPFLITVKWTNGEINSIDFEKFLSRERTNQSTFSKLFREEIFIQVKTDGRTLFWDDMTAMIGIDGSEMSSPIDFCPDVLYNFAKE